MRRSLAPSQQFRDVVKKPRFLPPINRLEKENDDSLGNFDTKSTLSETLKSIRKPNTKTDNCEPNTVLASEKFVPLPSTSTKILESQSDINASTHVRSESNDTTRLHNVVKNSDSNSSENDSVVTRTVAYKPKFLTKQFISPVIKSDDTSNTVSHCGDISASTDNGITSHYYSVVWCKNSRKKHKKWEGDAILVTRGKSVILKDMEGKDIGKSSGYKTSELSGLVEGSSLIVGGKEIEVMGVIKEEDWLSGKCFVDSTSSSSVSTADSNLATCNARTVASAVKKGFNNPLMGASLTAAKPMSQAVFVPYHNPNHPNALVLPRPPSSHQKEHNRAGLSLVDVVVDPYLVSRLRPHQKDGVIFLYECTMGFREYQGNGAILADDMGLGKTIQCISLLWTLLKQGAYGGKPVVKRALVVTPGSLVKNWCKEFNKWLGSERIEVFAVTSEKRPKEYVNSKIYPVMIVSYEMFMRCYEVIKDVNFDIIICDEGHRLKNTSTKTTMMLTSLPVRRRIVLTGTPIQNDLQEFYSIVEFCNPGILGSANAFRKVYEEPIVASRQPTATTEEKVMGEARANQLSDLISLFFLRRTQDINTKYLPDKVERVVFCRTAPLQLCLYKHLLRSRLVQCCLSASYSNSGSSCPHLQCLTVLKKLCNCPSLIYHEYNELDEAKDPLLGGSRSIFPVDLHNNNFTVEHSGKLRVLDMLLRQLHSLQSRDRIVLVSNYTKTLNLLQRLCEVRHYKFLRLDGSTTVSKRQGLVERFNSGYCSETVFLLSSKAGGVGLNLIGASHLILYDIEWNPANDIQAMARVWRDGQKKQVFIYRLLTTGTVEEKIYQRQISKQGLSGAVVDTSQPLHNTTFSREDLKDLFSLDETTLCNTHDLLNCTCTNTDNNMGRQSGDDIANSSTQHLHQISLSMDQLLQWTHHPSVNDACYVQDEDDRDLLRGVSDGVTFIFSNKVTNHPGSLT